ncbi:3-oxoadipate:succinyl-CoA transferase A subunit [Streptomyces lydicamycinicus]|uniref:3-oxoadipate:succinyl-CoA transferase A subunit n=2 Tax=Streptomyces lydicamycinicus TaxID=1546107 RepID=A0A0P4REY7_9ACTN|nr:3-oxoadipate:succinyl-CoA transferase A subunit [Streptomyces lydicamycinicus]
MADIRSLHEAVAELIHDGDTVALEGFTHLIPFAAAHEIIRQGIKDLTLARMTPDVVYDQLIGAGAARKLVFSWGGNPGVGSLHRFRDAVEHGWPAPLEIDEHSHAGMANRYAAGAARLPFAVLRGYRGSDIPARTPTVSTVVCPFTGEELAAVAALNPDVTVIHAQQADRAGNVQLWGLTGVQKEAALAARRVLVTVEEIVDALEPRPGSVVLPTWVVDAVALVPGGAHPSYAAGYSVRDNAYYREWDGIARDRAAFGRWLAECVRGEGNGVRGAAAGDGGAGGAGAGDGGAGAVPADTPERGPETTPETVPEAAPDCTPDELMEVNAARALAGARSCFVGIGLPSTAANLARRTVNPDLVLVYESGTLGSKPTRLPLSIGDGELADTADSVVSVPEMFNYWLQGGRIDVGFLGAAQVDRFANINTTVVDRGPGRPEGRLPGAGGAPEIAANCGQVLMVLRHRRRNFVGTLDFVTTLGHGAGPGDRAALGLPGAGPTAVITDLGVLRPDPDTAELVLTELHPGVTVDQVRAATGWDLREADRIGVTAPPTTAELAALRALKAAAADEPPHRSGTDA